MSDVNLQLPLHDFLSRSVVQGIIWPFDLITGCRQISCFFGFGQHEWEPSRSVKQECVEVQVLGSEGLHLKTYFLNWISCITLLARFVCFFIDNRHFTIWTSEDIDIMTAIEDRRSNVFIGVSQSQTMSSSRTCCFTRITFLRSTWFLIYIRKNTGLFRFTTKVLCNRRPAKICFETEISFIRTISSDSKSTNMRLIKLLSESFPPKRTL